MSRLALALLVPAFVMGQLRPASREHAAPLAREHDARTSAPSRLTGPAQATPGSDETRLYLPFSQHGEWYHGAVTFAVVGDYGVCALGEPLRCAASIRVAEMVKTWHPQFIVTTGDNNYPRGRWDTWDQNVAPYREYIPDRFEPAVGNHDYMCTECPDLAFRINFERELTRQFAKPNEGNPLLRFFVFDSNAADPDPDSGVSAKAVQRNPLPVQRTWLENGLRDAQACWRLVVMHHAPYSSTVDPGSNRLMQSRAGWAYRQWGADVVLSGHAHSYERITRPGGFAYIVNGSSGAQLDVVAAARVPGSAVLIDDAYGALRGYADAERLVLEYYAIDMSAPAAEPQLRDTHRVARDCNTPARHP